MKKAAFLLYAALLMPLVSYAEFTLENYSESGNIFLFAEREYFYRGLTRSHDVTSYGLHFNYQTDTFYKIGTELRRVDFNGEPTNKRGANIQITTYTGFNFDFPLVRFDFGLQSLNYPFASTSIKESYDYTESYIILKLGTESYNVVLSAQHSENYFRDAGRVTYEKIQINLNVILGLDIFLSTARQNYVNSRNGLNERLDDYLFHQIGAILGIEEFSVGLYYGKVDLGPSRCPIVNGCEEKVNFTLNIGLD